MSISLPLSCATCDKLLPEYYDGDIESSLGAAVAEHLAHCSRCVDAIANFSLAMGALHRIPQPALGDLSKKISTALTKPSTTPAWRYQKYAVAAAAVFVLACSMCFGFWTARATELPVEQQLKQEGFVATPEGWLVPAVVNERLTGHIWLNGKWLNRDKAAEQLLLEQAYSNSHGSWLNAEGGKKILQGQVLTPSGWTTVDQLISSHFSKMGLSPIGNSWIDAKDVQGLRRDGLLVTTDQIVQEQLNSLGYICTNDGIWRLAEEENRIAKGEVRVGETWTTVQAIALENRNAKTPDQENKIDVPSEPVVNPPDGLAAQVTHVLPAYWKKVSGVPNINRAPIPKNVEQAERDALNQIHDGNGGKNRNLSANDITLRKKERVGSSPKSLNFAVYKIKNNALTGTPAVIAGRVHLCGNSNTVYSIDFENNTGWETRLSDTTPSNPVAYDEEDVTYTTGSCTLYALSGKTGAVLMNKWLASELYSMPVTNGKLLVTTMPGWITAIDGKSGYPQWVEQTPSEVRSGILSVGTRLFCTTKDGSLTAYEGESGKVIWQRRIAGISAPAVRGKDLYVRRLLYNKGDSTLGESVAVLDSDNGRVRSESLGTPRVLKGFLAQPKNTNNESYEDDLDVGELELNNGLHVPEFASPVITQSSTIVVFDHVIEARSVDDGKVLWATNIENQGNKNKYLFETSEHCDPVIAGNMLIIGCLDGQVRGLDVETGKLLWSVDVGSAMGWSHNNTSYQSMRRCQPTVVTGKIYITTMTGELVVIDTNDKALNGPRWWGDCG